MQDDFDDDGGLDLPDDNLTDDGPDLGDLDVEGEGEAELDLLVIEHRGVIAPFVPPGGQQS